MHLVGPPILQQCQKPTIPSREITFPTGKPPLTVSQNPCARLFFAINPDISSENLVNLLNQSWKYDPLTTLKLICYLRTIRGDPSFHNEGFYDAAIWLHKKHPLTLACNLREFVAFGLLTDFTEVLYRLVHEEGELDYDVSREERERARARRAVCKYVQDPAYRFLHERVSDLFSDMLRSDLESLKSGDVKALSFAAADCPSIDCADDRNTLICESIAKKVFPKENDPVYKNIEDVHYVYRVRDRLRKEVLGPLRTALDGRVEEETSNVEPQDLTLNFIKKAYQMKEKKSKLRYYHTILGMIVKANIKHLGPSPLSIFSSLNNENSKAKEVEWQNMVQALSKNEKLRDSIAVCDVSEGMKETSKNISVSMGLMISELSSGMYRETVYSYHRSPTLKIIEGGDLRSKGNFIKKLECTVRVNIEAILNQILQASVRCKVGKNDLVKRVFVFTNKPLKAANNCWGWNYRAVWDNYQKCGYDCVPEVVFWNLEGSNACPPLTREVIHNRLTIIEGFSMGLLAFFLDKDAVSKAEEIRSVATAEDVMRITLSGKQYQNLAVLD